jgi:hypothetical protein
LPATNTSVTAMIVSFAMMNLVLSATDDSVTGAGICIRALV